MSDKAKDNGEDSDAMFNLYSRFDTRVRLLLKSDAQGVYACISTIVAEALYELKNNLDESTPNFVMFTKIESTLEGAQEAVEDFLNKNHSEYLNASITFTPPNEIIVSVTVDDYYAGLLSQSIH